MNDEYEDDANRAFVIELYTHLLNRAPSDKELQNFTGAASRLSAAELVRRFVESPEYKRHNKIKPFFPDGHFHSPVVDPSTVEEYVASRRSPGIDFKGITIDLHAIEAFWDMNRDSIAGAPFPETKTDDFRFFFDGAPFPYGDALTLHAIMGHFKPKRIVEIGSGFSTACMLDSAEIHGIGDLRITCIEPFPKRLRSLLRPADYAKVELISRPVQEVPVQDIVGQLDRNDILFIDSTHVLKTGSDVHYEIFEIIPAVKEGVIIHLHDCPYPFEYPSKWIEQNYSWNEAYAIQAFLMYNESFRILFWGGLFKSLFHDKAKHEGGRFIKNSGTSLWLARN
jgi:hypothetical protein